MLSEYRLTPNTVLNAFLFPSLLSAGHPAGGVQGLNMAHEKNGGLNNGVAVSPSQQKEPVVRALPTHTHTHTQMHTHAPLTHAQSVNKPLQLSVGFIGDAVETEIPD